MASWGSHPNVAQVFYLRLMFFFMETMVGYRAPQWREEVYKEMFHLDNKSRLRMGKAAIKYFMVLFDLIKGSADSKVKGLEIEKSNLEQEYSYSKKCKSTQVMC